ncbi:hypothetical protein K9N50_11435, partial [bacterium]|nr:hypothetical protein [bacterium]
GKEGVMKIGDTVICIDDYADFNRLKLGREYTVEAAYDGTPVVIVDGGYMSIERFKLKSNTLQGER